MTSLDPLKAYGPTLEPVGAIWRLTLGGDPDSPRGIWATSGPDPDELVRRALEWTGRDRFAHVPRPSGRVASERGAAPADASPEPEPPSERIVENPETVARLKAAERELEALRAKLDSYQARPNEGVPEELRDLMRENEPHAEALARFRAIYTDLTNRLVDSRLPPLSDAERELQNRLQKALYSERKGAVEIAG